MNTPFQIDKITVYPQFNRIKIENRQIGIEPRVMKLLVYLVKKNGELCSRDELVDSIWGGDYVNKNAITRAMSDLRKAFDDSSTSPKYFETIPKQGYRFIGLVEWLDQGENKSEKNKSNRIYWRVAGIVLVILTAGLAYSALSTPKITYGNKVVRKSVPVIVEDTTNLPDSVFHKKVEAIVDATVEKEMR